MSFRPIPAVFHAAGLSIMSYGYLSLGTAMDDTWIREQTCGHGQFLTIHGLAVAWLTMALSVGADLFPSSQKLNQVKRLFLMIALPLAIVVSSIYWTLMLLFPHLILPPAEFSPADSSDPTPPSSSSSMPDLYRIPLQVDLALHASPALFLLVDFLFLERKYSKLQATYLAPLVAVAFGVWYASCAEYCASYNGNFPYPFLTLNPFSTRVLIYGGATLLAVISFRVINAFHPGGPILSESGGGNPIAGAGSRRAVMRSSGADERVAGGDLMSFGGGLRGVVSPRRGDRMQ